MERSESRRRTLLVVLAVSVVALAGCGLPGGANSGSGGAEGQTYPGVVDRTTASLSEENASAFLAAMTDDSGELTPVARAWVDRLEAVESVGTTQRDAVARSLATGGLGEGRLTRLDAVLAAPPAARQTILRDGLRDTSGDGLLDGEARLLGLDRTERYPTVSAAARELSAGGYENESLAYLDRLSARIDSEFQRAQIRGFGLVSRSVANGSVTAGDRRALADRSGDGLLDGTARELGLAPNGSHPVVSGLAESLATNGYSETELSYLSRISNASKNRSLWAQAAAVGLRDGAAGDGSVDPAVVAGLEVTGTGLLAGFAAEIGLTNRTDNATVGRLATRLADAGYTETELTYLRRAATVTAVPPRYAQARTLSLLEQPTTDGTVTTEDSDALVDSSGDGLLDPMARQIGVDPATANPRLGELAGPLAVGGYGDTELAYLERVAALRPYRGNGYERWAQARQLGLLDDAVANGTVTEGQLGALGNDDEDRLLNGIEAEFGTDPQRADTSGDGYLDHLVWGPMRDLGLSVTPGEPDVYVELDSVSGQEPASEAQLRDVAETFRSEPDDVGPINVHFFRCDSDRPDVSRASQMGDRIAEDRTLRGLGFHYLLVTDGSLTFRGTEVSGLTYTSTGDQSWMVIDGTLSQRVTPTHEASALAHELGHSLGLSRSAFEGIDSRAYSDGDYESVMNYNHWTPVTFSRRAPFDDYRWMAEQSFGSYHQNRTRLEATWQTGSVEGEVGCRRVVA
ncbi:hypothetical protein GRX03_11120 [Halovenus sp. WSH3]|uniref:Uncharacterized protein n=1 Tax=Halovenus carboxidivorans TaxID=2692199 RepID=A0A6B0T1R8_9EURY|nr:hypothetical protein [Halovenus carboxidivorans]MXR52148.1 hypothetical protein [Halovenus carboxidivorans]